MKKTNQRLEFVALNNYVKPDPHALMTQSGEYVTNGADNSYFYEVEKYYLGSPTNQAIIDGYAGYILGDGLEVLLGDVNIEDIIDEEDLRNLVTDFKMHGSCVLQVDYQKGKDKKVAKLYYIATKSVGIHKQADITDEIESFWFCFDWNNKSVFKPYVVPAFGYGENKQSELLYIKRQSPQPLFPLPDYQSGVQWCKTEEEISNYCVNHIKNNFSIGKVVNVNEPIEDEDDALEEAEATIISKVSGSSKAGGILVSFNTNKENATTVENIEITDAYHQFEFLSAEASKKIMLAHKVNDPALFGLPLPSGFSSQAEQMAQSLKILFRNQIKPMRNIITRGIEKALKLNDPKIKLGFKDTEELNVEATKPTANAPINANSQNIDVFDAKTLEAQASLKGSVGGVTALLQIQNSYSQGLTDRDSAITMLKVIFGYDDTTANELLGKPKLEKTV